MNSYEVKSLLAIADVQVAHDEGKLENLAGLRYEVALGLLVEVAKQGTLEAYRRVKKACDLILNNAFKDGLTGCVFEMCLASRYSCKDDLSEANEADIYIKYKPAGASNYGTYKCEVKTGNGDINDLYNKKTSAFVAYAFILDNSNGRKYCPPQLFRKSDFLAFLENNGLIQECPPDKNHPIARRRIKGQSAKLYRFLCEYGLPLDNNAVYCEADFEDVDYTI